jgi:hypothetical protein
MERMSEAEDDQGLMRRDEHPVAHAGSGSSRVPGKREVDLYVRTYTTLLQSSGAIPVSALIPAHLTASSSLHAGAEEAAPDLNAFIYSAQRLPESISHVTDIVLGQSARGFRRNGYADLDHWQIVSAPGRRRRWRFDGERTLAATIASASDLDDLVPSIVAYQIEWNKMHGLIEADPVLAGLIARAAAGEELTDAENAEYGARLLLEPADWQRLQAVWGPLTWPNFVLIASQRKRFTLKMIGALTSAMRGQRTNGGCRQNGCFMSLARRNVRSSLFLPIRTRS